MSEPEISVPHDVPSISVILPAYNEEEGIGPTLQAVLQGVTMAGVTFEIIVVDDGSTDRTAERSRRPGIELLQHDRRMGYGASIKDGIRKAKHEWIVLCDADGTYPADRVLDLLRAASPDVPHVMGQRSLREPFLRSLFRTFFFTLARFVAGSWIPDVNSGFQLLRRDLALEHAPFLPQGFSCTTTLPLLTVLSGRNLAHVPIPFGRRIGEVKLRVVRDGLGAVQTVCRICWQRRPGKFMLSLVVLLGVACAAGLGVVRLLR
jgi:glycosyltransferase involved in cell wall biosynthesis